MTYLCQLFLIVTLSTITLSQAYKDDPPDSLLGGISKELPANAFIVELFENLFPKIQSSNDDLKSITFDDIDVISYKTQLVNGMNRWIKYKVKNSSNIYETLIYESFIEKDEKKKFEVVKTTKE